MLLLHFKSCFDVEIFPSAETAVKKLLKIFENEYTLLQKEAEEAVKQIKKWNSKPFCFAIDVDALASHRFNCGAIDYATATAELTAFAVQLEIEAYLKVQSSAIIEASFKQISIILYQQGYELLEKVINDKMPSDITLVEDSEEIKSERESMINRKKILEECVTIMKEI